MQIIYRISDGGYSKVKPAYVTKKNCFMHFLQVFKGYPITVIADNVCDETYSFLKSFISPIQIHRTSLNNAASFLYAVKFAMDNFPETEKVYFAEDDYVYTQNAPFIIFQGLDIADYTTGYDHPDKYINNGPNPLVAFGGEITRVVVSPDHHWKFTNSTCMTFATTVKLLKEDYPVYVKYCSSTHPHDFQMFTDLIQNRKRKLISALPAVSTHGETQWLASFVDWEFEMTKSLVMMKNQISAAEIHLALSSVNIKP